MKFNLITISALSLLFAFSVTAQEIKEKKVLKKAQKYLAEANYDNAKEEYAKLIQSDGTNSLYHFEMGIAYYNSFYQREESIKHFENALQASSSDTISEIFYYLGKSNQYVGNFEVAKQNYLKFESYILDNKEGGYVNSRVDRFIVMCDNAIALKAYEDQDSEITLKNLGGGVNSKYAEYGSIAKSDGSLLLYTARDRENEGKKYYFDSKKFEDIYVSESADTSWSTRTKIDSSKNYFKSSINTKKHDAVIGFSEDEEKLYVYRKNGIWVSTLKNGKYGDPVELEDINTKGHEPSAFLTPDEKTLYFTSNSYEGNGGRDIFTTTLNADSTWGEPVNLGAKINTQFDEDAPFLTNDGNTLFFSSNGHNTIGGYDIFKSEKDESGNWSTPVNMGVAVNSAADDIYYTQDTLGELGYLSSGRAYGYGDMDIYSVSLLCKNIPNTEIRGLIVMGNSLTPLKAYITAVNAETGENAGTFTSDPATGKYLMVLPPDNTYYLTVASDKHSKLERPFRDTLVLPRQCEYYQMFQHIGINEVKEEQKLTAYEAVFDNATFDVKSAAMEKYEVDDIESLLTAASVNQSDSVYNLTGRIMHNEILSAINTRVSLVNDKGEVIKTVMTNNAGQFEFEKLHHDYDYSLLVNEDDLLMSYYGNNPTNSEKSIISKGNLIWNNVRNDNSLIGASPADSLEILLVDNDFVVVNKSMSNVEGNWAVDNLPSTPVADTRSFPYNLQMEDEDLIYKDLLKDIDTAENEFYTVIRDLIAVPEDVVIGEEPIAFEPIYFDFDKFFLRLASKDILDKIQNYLVDNPEVSIEIMGHTDWFGSDDYNMKLSKRRSKSAFDYLTKAGIDKSRLTMKWYGEAQPAVPNAFADGSDNEDNRQLNRRCEFKISDGTTAYSIFLY